MGIIEKIADHRARLVSDPDLKSDPHAAAIKRRAMLIASELPDDVIEALEVLEWAARLIVFCALGAPAL